MHNYAWFPVLRIRSYVSVSVTVYVIVYALLLRGAVTDAVAVSVYRVPNGYGKIELDPIRTDERKRKSYGNG